MNLKFLLGLLLLVLGAVTQSGCADMDSPADNTTVGEPSMTTHDDNTHGWGTHIGQAGTGRQ